MLIRVSTELSYRDFAELASSYLSTRPDRFQFFASVASNSTATGGAAASPVLNTSKSAPQPPPTTAQEVATNPSPESIAGNDGNGYSPNNNGFSGASLISEQTKAARASGEGTLLHLPPDPRLINKDFNQIYLYKATKVIINRRASTSNNLMLIRTQGAWVCNMTRDSLLTRPMRVSFKVRKNRLLRGRALHLLVRG